MNELGKVLDSRVANNMGELCMCEGTGEDKQEGHSKAVT
jgi:hypothetical protein